MRTKITSNILADISRKLQNNTNTNNNDNAIILFNGSNIKLEERLKEIKGLKEGGLNISVGFSFMADQIIDSARIINALSPDRVYKEEDIFKLQGISKEYKKLIGPNITINTLSKVALGMIDSFVPNLIWTFLYYGREVYLDFTSVRNYLGEETKNKTIRNIIEANIRTIKDMGAIEIGEGDYTRVLGESNISPPGSTDANISNDKKVLVEKDITSMAPNTRLTLSKGTIITSLARDRAKEKNIIIDIK